MLLQLQKKMNKKGSLQKRWHPNLMKTKIERSNLLLIWYTSFQCFIFHLYTHICVTKLEAGYFSFVLTSFQFIYYEFIPMSSKIPQKSDLLNNYIRIDFINKVFQLKALC